MSHKLGVYGVAESESIVPLFGHAIVGVNGGSTATVSVNVKCVAG